MAELSRFKTGTVHQLVTICRWSQLGFLHFASTLRRMIGWIHTIARYYRKNLAFAYSDTLLWGQYIFKSPYYISKIFSRNNLYGETPLRTLDIIARKSRLLSSDVVYDIGCGTGRTVLFLHHIVKCQAIGIEHVPTFVARAQRVKRWRRLDNVQFLQKNALECSFAGATWIYFYGTAREAMFISQLADKIAKTAPQASIITTSYPLSDYDARFEATFLCKGRFPWGKADVYVNRLCL